jgi:hypothetical protein
MTASDMEASQTPSWENFGPLGGPLLGGASICNSYTITSDNPWTSLGLCGAGSSVDGDPTSNFPL